MGSESKAVKKCGVGVWRKGFFTLVLLVLFCFLLPYCFGLQVVGQSLKLSVVVSVDGKSDPANPSEGKFCKGINSDEVKIWIGWDLGPGVGTPTVSWTANGHPVPAGLWNQVDRCLRVQPTEPTVYVGTFQYTLFGNPKTETIEAKVYFYEKPTIALNDVRFAPNARVSLCGGVGDIELKNYDRDAWSVKDDATSAFSFNDGKFVYGGGAGTDAGEVLPFKFTVSQQAYEACRASFSAEVKVYKPKEVAVDLDGAFCAGVEQLKESFNGVPSGGTCDVSLHKKGAAVAEWTKSVDEAKVVKIDAPGEYELKTRYSFLLPGTTNEQCPSEELTNGFRVVAVPAAPEWEGDPSPTSLSACGPTELKMKEISPCEEGITYSCTLHPGDVKKTWNKGGAAIGYSVTEPAQYRVELVLEDVKVCPVLESAPLEVKMQRTLEGVRIAPEPSVLLCVDANQSLKAEEQKIGFTDITLQGGGAPVDCKYRWVYNETWTGGEKAIVAEAKELTFKKDGSGSGQQGGLKPKEGVNKYVLQYKLADAAEGCWKNLGGEFAVTVTPRVVNEIALEGDGICKGVEVQIQNKSLSGGDSHYRVEWWRDGAMDKGGAGTEGYGVVEQVGKYTRKVTSGGCVSESNEVTVKEFKNPSIELVSFVEPHCSAVKDGAFVVKAMLASPEKVSFSFDNGDSWEAFSASGTNMTKNSLGVGEYTIQCKSDKGCIAEPKVVSFLVEEFKVEDVTGLVPSCWGKPVEVSLKWEGGALRAGESYYVTLTKENGTPELAAVVPGTIKEYKKEVTSGKYEAKVSFPKADGACFATQSFEIKDPKSLSPKVYDVLCPGGSDGIVRATLENAMNVRYVLERDSSGIWLMEGANSDGLFIGLRQGKYRVRASLSADCVSPDKVVEVKGEELPKMEWRASSTEVRCPGGVVDQLEVKITPGGDYVNYIWNRKTAKGTSYITTKQPSLFDAGAGKYTLTLVREDGCTMHSETLVVKGALPFAWTQPPTVTAAECDGYKGNEVSKGSVVLYGVTGGDAPKAWWATTPNPEDRDQLVQYNMTYYLRSGSWKVRVEDAKGCKGELTVDVGYVPTNSVKFLLRYPREGTSLCFGEQLQGVRVEEAATSYSEIDNTVPPIITVEREERGRLLVDTLVRAADGTYSSFRGVEPGSVMRAVVQSKKGCRSEVTAPVSVYPAISVKYDPLLSDVNVFFHQQVDDASRSWRGADGRIVHRVLKDSIVAGVLAEVPRKVGVEVDYLPYLLQGLTYTTEPEGVFTPDPDRKNAFEILLTADAIERYRAEGRVVSAQFGRKPIEVLRTTIRVADPKTSCSEDLDIYVRLIRELSIPNVFTPNGDGVNDRWLCNSDPTYQTIFSKLTTLLPNIEVEVFNRAGARVWHAKGEQVAEGWDGTAGGVYGGAELPVGTYYYVIRFNIEGVNSWKPVSGSVTIVR